MRYLSSSGRGRADVVLTYAEVRPWVKAIRAKVVSRDARPGTQIPDMASSERPEPDSGPD